MVEEPLALLLEPVKPPALARKEPSELRVGRSEEVRLWWAFFQVFAGEVVVLLLSSCEVDVTSTLSLFAMAELVEDMMGEAESGSCRSESRLEVPFAVQSSSSQK